MQQHRSVLGKKINFLDLNQLPDLKNIANMMVFFMPYTKTMQPKETVRYLPSSLTGDLNFFEYENYSTCVAEDSTCLL